MDITQATSFCVSAAAISAAAVLVLERFARSLGLIDVPGGRKAHAREVPLVGGLAIFISLLTSAWCFGFAREVPYFLLALSLLIAVGLWDDVADIRPRIKFGVQVVAAAVMIWGAGIQLHTVGDLIGWRPIGLSFLAIPLTVFALVGVVNAINMMDGIDGLAGCIALVAFAWYAIVAAESGLGAQAAAALVIACAIAGFLVFNLRFPWQRHARVFLGDAGSLMLGFGLGWYAVDLTQGPGRTFPPIAALWVVLLPLADCVSLMVRRVSAGRSPFKADRLHIHHYLLARGFSPSQVLAILVGISVLCGAVGYFAWVFQVPESVLFYPFFFGFFAYHAWIQKAWERMEREAPAAPSMRDGEDEDAARAT